MPNGRPGKPSRSAERAADQRRGKCAPRRPDVRAAVHRRRPTRCQSPRVGTAPTAAEPATAALVTAREETALGQDAVPPAHKDLVHRAFIAQDLNRRWLADTTKHNTGEASAGGTSKTRAPDVSWANRSAHGCDSCSVSLLCRWRSRDGTHQERGSTRTEAASFDPRSSSEGSPAASSWGR